MGAYGSRMALKELHYPDDRAVVSRGARVLLDALAA